MTNSIQYVQSRILAGVACDSANRFRRMFAVCFFFVISTTMVMPSFAQGRVDWGKIQLEITKVAGTVHMIRMVKGPDGFAAGNIGVSIGTDGIVLVDDMFEPLAPKILAALKTLSDKPVKFVINTHVHDDHINGNSAFGPTAAIIAHANTRKQLSTQGAGSEDKGPPAVALPIITIDDRLTLHQNGEDIRIIHFPRTHSGTDIVIFFTQSNVVHMGDMYSSGMYPYIDRDRGGSIKGLIAGIEKVLSDIPADAKIIPGHGPLSNTTELRSTLAMLKETSAIVENGIKNKQSLKQMSEAKVFAKYDKWAHGYINADGYLEQLYKDLAQ